MDYLLEKTEERTVGDDDAAAIGYRIRKMLPGALAAILLLGVPLVPLSGAYAVTDETSSSHVVNNEMVQAVMTETYRQNHQELTTMALTGKELSDQKKVEDEHQAWLASEEGQREQLVEAAKSRLRVPYAWGGTDPDNGMDCSGFTQWCYSQIGIDIPRTSYAQESSAGEVVPVSAAKPGDILCSDGHVGIYIGDGKFIHEPQSGDVCRISEDMAQFHSAARYI